MTEDKKFETLTDEYLKEYFKFSPGHGVNLGLHEYDGKLPDTSPEGFAKTKDFYTNYSAKLKEINYDALSPRCKYDYELMDWQFESGLFELEVVKSYKLNPMYYMMMLGGINTYLSRDYAPFDERLRSIIEITKQIPIVIENAKINLNKETADVFCKYAKLFAGGYVTFFERTLLDAINEKSTNTELINEYVKYSSPAVEAIKDYIKFIDESLVKTETAYKLGKELFMSLLKKTEQIDISFEELKRLGEDELKRLSSEMQALFNETDIKNNLDSIEKDHPKEANLISDTKNTLNELINFMRENNVVNLPEETNCIVTEMPSYNRFGFAAMDTAGPFEKSDESFYYVSPPLKEWTEEKRDEWLELFNYPTLKMISIHEAFPGHYTHFLNINKYSTRLGKMFMSYSYVEGWAHYTEEMMLEMGYGKNDNNLKFAQIKEALIRCCRYLVAIGLHAEDMTIEQAAKFFMDNAYMNEVTAFEEAQRGAYDPGYLNYTLGKIMLKRVREKYFDKFGEEKSLKDFHNKIVAMGCPTWSISEKYILADTNGENVMW